MNTIYNITNVLQRGTLRLFADWKVAGAENVPPVGPIVIVSNHLSNFDPSLLSCSLPRRLNYLAKDGIFRAVGPPGRWYLKHYGAFPIDRGGADVAAFRWSLRQLQRDAALVIFPEGTRSQAAGMNQAKSGVASLILRSGAPVLPVGITGTERLGAFLRVVNPTGRIRVNIGQPFSLPNLEGRPGRELLESMTTDIMHRVCDLLPEDYHGHYARSNLSNPIDSKTR